MTIQPLTIHMKTDREFDLNREYLKENGIKRLDSYVTIELENGEVKKKMTYILSSEGHHNRFIRGGTYIDTYIC